MWMQDGCQLYMASNGSCLMVTSTIFKNYLLKEGLTQNRETMALQIFTTVDLFYFNMCENLHEWKFIEMAFGWGPGHIWLHITFEGPWPHYMILEVCWDGLWRLSFGLSQFHGHGSVWSGPKSFHQEGILINCTILWSGRLWRFIIFFLMMYMVDECLKDLGSINLRIKRSGWMLWMQFGMNILM